jgi:hypothetical protein
VEKLSTWMGSEEAEKRRNRKKKLEKMGYPPKLSTMGIRI